MRLGDLDLQSDTDDAQPQDFLITERFANPTYAPPQQYGDIALLRLDRDAILTPYVRPICLQTGRDLPSFSPIATGWGKLQFGGELSDVLMKVGTSYQRRVRYRLTQASTHLTIKLVNKIGFRFNEFLSFGLGCARITRTTKEKIYRSNKSDYLTTVRT